MLRLEADTVTSSPIEIPFSFEDKATLPEGKALDERIIIRPITVQTWFQLKPLLASIEKADYDKLVEKDGAPSFGPDVEAVMAKYDNLLFKIVCIGIHNKSGDMPNWFKEVLKANSTWEDIFILLNAIFFRLNHNPFMNSITALKVVSPLEEEEIIALQKNKEAWNRKAALRFLSQQEKHSDTHMSKH